MDSFTEIKATRQTASITVRPLTFRIGAELGGIDLSRELPEKQIAEIRTALLTHRVVFIRGQRIGISEQTAFARRLGELTASHPTVGSTSDDDRVYEIDSTMGARADEWHTDVSFADRPPAIAVLRAVAVPPYGGDTIWANTVDAYQRLPETLRAYVDELRVIHSNVSSYADSHQVLDAARRQHLEEFTSEVFVTNHPMVRLHAETQEKSLLLGSFAQTVVNLTPQASHDLLRLLADYITVPENTVRWSWREGDVAIWDNRATQHYAIHDYENVRRVMQRVTVAGTIPVGVDGSPSVALQGDAAGYSPVGSF